MVSLVIGVVLDKEEVGEVLGMEAESPPATPRHQGLWGRFRDNWGELLTASCSL